VPTVRTLISVPAGLSEMPLPRFLMWSGAGTLVWTTLLGLAGWWLGDRYEAVEAWINPVSNVVVGLIVLLYLYRVATFRHEPQGASRQRQPGRPRAR
jgi:membrane protein DedA with SNARE-associated domain